jgi:hypothetical protein
VSAIGVLQDDPRALALVRFLLGREAQATLAKDTGEYPLAAGLPPPPGLPAVTAVRTPDIDYSDVGAVLEQTDRALRKVGLLTTPAPASERLAGVSAAEGESAGEEGAASAPLARKAGASTAKAGHRRHATKGKHASKGKASARKKAAPTRHRRKKKPAKPPR